MGEESGDADPPPPLPLPPHSPVYMEGQKTRRSVYCPSLLPDDVVIVRVGASSSSASVSFFDCAPVTVCASVSVVVSVNASISAFSVSAAQMTPT